MTQTMVRTYHGSQDGAAHDYARDAQRLAIDGWFPVSQVWQPGSWGCGAFLIALALCIVLVGLLVFVYMLIVKPAGTLTVTYGRTARIPLGTCPRCTLVLDSHVPACPRCGQPIVWA